MTYDAARSGLNKCQLMQQGEGEGGRGPQHTSSSMRNGISARACARFQPAFHQQPAPHSLSPFLSASSDFSDVAILSTCLAGSIILALNTREAGSIILSLNTREAGDLIEGVEDSREPHSPNLQKSNNVLGNTKALIHRRRG